MALLSASLPIRSYLFVCAPAQNISAILGEVQRQNRPGMPFDCLGLDMGAWIPQIDGAVEGATGQDILIGRKTDRRAFLIMAGEL